VPLPRLSLLSFGLALLTTLLTAGLILADDIPKWDQAPGNGMVEQDKECKDKRGAAPCAFTVGNCYGFGVAGSPPMIGGALSAKAIRQLPWGYCLMKSGQMCTKFDWVACMEFHAYTKAGCKDGDRIVMN
jgi:hypothetical protein